MPDEATGDEVRVPVRAQHRVVTLDLDGLPLSFTAMTVHALASEPMCIVAPSPTANSGALTGLGVVSTATPRSRGLLFALGGRARVVLAPVPVLDGGDVAALVALVNPGGRSP